MLMAMSATIRSYTTARFREALRLLPPEAKRLAEKCFRTFKDDPWAPALGRKPLTASEGVEFVKVGLHYRAFLRRGLLPNDNDNVVVWEWIGTTEEAHNYYWQSFPMSEPTPNRPKPPKRSKKKPGFVKTWKSKPEESPMPAVAEEPEVNVAAPAVAPVVKTIYTGVAAQLETMLAQINEIETKKSSAEQNAEASFAEIVRLEDEKKGHLARIAQLEKELESSKHATSIAINEARSRTIGHKHEVEGLAKRITGLEHDNSDLKKQLTKIQKQVRKLGEFCRHCGKNHETGLMPGETE